MTTILIIDDSANDRVIYRGFLGQSPLHFQVHEAEDGQSGLTLAEQLNPDCILLDLNLPDQSGYEVLGHLVGLGRPPQRTVIVLAEVGGEILAEGAMALGAAGFLVKSRVDALTLNRTIQQALRIPPN